MAQETSESPQSHEWGVTHASTTEIEIEEFEEIEPSLSTGDVAVLQRDGQETPHYGIFVRAGHLDPQFPLLLVKTQTKPLRIEAFDRNRRNLHLVTAQNRIFYGDYKFVSVLKLAKRPSLISSETTISLVEKIRGISYSDAEVVAIMAGKTPEERSAIACTLTLSLVFKDLGLLDNGLATLTIKPEELRKHLPLADGGKGSRHIRIPKPHVGPMASGEGPLLSRMLK